MPSWLLQTCSLRRLTCINEDEGNKIVYFKDTMEPLTLTILARNRGSAWSCCKVGAKSEVLKQLVLCACGKMPGSFCFLLHGSKTVISR
jgi:hypothetical protein